LIPGMPELRKSLRATDGLRRRDHLRLSFSNVISAGLVLVIVAQTRGVTIGPPVQIGTIAASAIPETSGIVDSRANADTFWVHNDSGHPSEFFAIDHQGNVLGTFPLSGAPLGDWEDIAIGPKPGGGNYLYLGDIGDNDAVRPFISVYRTDEPQSTTGATIPVGSYSPAKLQYPGGPRNAESLFVDPLTNDVYILTKTANAEIYSAPASVFDDAGQTTVLTALGVLGTLLSKATAADISPDGRHILVRSKSVAYMFERGIGQSVADALHGTGIPFMLGAESQGEAIGWAADANSFFTTSESNGLKTEPIYSYAFAALTGDYNGDGVIDAADYAAWRDAMTSGAPLTNDSNGNGVADPDDFTYWRAHYGESAPGGGAGAGAVAVAVPEPASWALAALGLLVCGVRRTRR
jgi:PEP-CTERM motif